MDIAFALNYTNYYEIDITPNESASTWARVGAGINSVDWNGNEVNAQDPYYDGEGMGSSEVTGGQLIGTFSGHRKYGDAAQDFIAGMLLDYGSGRHTNFRWTSPSGQVLEGDVTIANINPQGGDPNSKSTFGFEVHFNGRPTFTPGDKTQFPESITASAISVAKNATTSVGATVTPSSASAKLSYAIEDETKATVDADGTITGVAVGSTTLVMKSVVLPSVTKEITVTVTNGV